MFYLILAICWRISGNNETKVWRKKTTENKSQKEKRKTRKFQLRFSVTDKVKMQWGNIAWAWLIDRVFKVIDCYHSFRSEIHLLNSWVWRWGISIDGFAMIDVLLMAKFAANCSKLVFCRDWLIANNRVGGYDADEIEGRSVSIIPLNKKRK